MRLALGIEYDGTDFQGWQRLGHGPSVQAELEAALGFVADAPTVVQCAGRTDSGVHALCQVVHFDTDAVRQPRGWILGCNSRLPQSISVRWVVQVADDFNARYAARARRYRYRILDRNVRPALLRRYVAWERRPLVAEPMHAAAQALLGEHDFTAFRAVQCQARHAVRNVQDISVRREGEEVVVDIRANAFLHHMVRNIVGLLLAVGTGRVPPDRARQQIEGRERSLGEATAAAHGLYLWRVDYPPEFGLPADSAIMEPHVVV
jgi:tRNA pseudouridine38-40 synthase